jgi:hypothetical protein
MIDRTTTSFAILRTRNILHRKRSRSSPRDIIFDAEHVFARCNTKEPLFTPVCAPGVSNMPEFFTRGCILTPSNDRYNVIRGFGLCVIIKYLTTHEIAQRVSIDRSSNRPSCLDFLFNSHNNIILAATSNQTILCNGGIRVIVQSNTVASSCAEGTTRTASVESTTSGVDMRAESFLRLCRACNVWLAPKAQRNEK